MSESLSKDESYLILYRFLQLLLDSTGHPYIRTLADDLTIGADGESLDPAAMDMFIQARNDVRQGIVNPIATFARVH